MNTQDSVGRIQRDAFVISTAVLLALALLAVATRFIVRFLVQKLSFSIDDGFLLVAAACLLISIIVLYHEVLDRMYFVIAMQTRLEEGVIPPPDFVQITYQFHKWVTVCNMAGWCAVMAVKFSFMFFFRKLIDRLPYLNMYWWFVVVYNVGCLGFGISVYYIGCPFYFDPRSLQCASGVYEQILVHYSVAQMVLDLVGDVMILAMPICIIWQIRVRWSQKVALMFSLCLTVFMMATTITRVSGLIHHGKVDTIWETYWTAICAEVGVFMAAATAFRTFFVTRNNSKTYKNGRGLKYFFSDSLAARFRRKKTDLSGDTWDTRGSSDLPGIPRAQITGLRTFIDGQGKTQSTLTERSQAAGSSCQITWTL